MNSARALKPALSLRPSTANRPGMHSRGSSQGSMRSLSRSHTPTPSPSATAAEARCYFSIPSASTATNTNTDVGIGGGGTKTATRKPAPSTESHSSPHCCAWLHRLLVDTADVVSYPQQQLADLTQARILLRPTQRANRRNASGGAGPLRLILEAAGRVAGPLIPRLSPCRREETFTGTFLHCGWAFDAGRRLENTTSVM